MSANPLQLWMQQGHAARKAGRSTEALDHYHAALEQDPESAEANTVYGLMLLRLGRAAEAEAPLRKAVEIAPKHVAIRMNLAQWLTHEDRLEEAAGIVASVVADEPQQAWAWERLGELEARRKNFEEASEHFRRATEIQPKDPSMLFKRAQANFDAGKTADAERILGEAALAFIAYEQANRLARRQGRVEGLSYEREARTKQIDELISFFDAVPGTPTGTSIPRPLFIIGMPRSGTTLVESVIGAHSKVLACGERMPMRWIMQELLFRAREAPIAKIDADTWRQWRDLYWQGLPAGQGAEVVTDKNPWNVDAIGAIALLFPDARVIHVRRNPVETGLSIYRNQFSKSTQYANRLEDIAHYYGEYARLMAHWERVASGRFTTIQYEDFVRDFDTAGPELLSACGLEWEPACRNFWESKRVIGTMSTIQARRPLESRASRAEHYGPRLKPLKDALSEAGVDLDIGAWRGNS